MKVNEIPKNNDLLFTLIKKLRSRYINLELDKECYRELNSTNNKFRLNETICGMSLYVDDIEDLNNVNIIYNYNKLILPFISILI